MKHRKVTREVQIRVTGKTGEIDGYVELLLGTFMVAGVLIKHKLGKKTRPNGISQIYIDLELMPPPLGDLGETDIPPMADNEGEI